QEPEDEGRCGHTDDDDRESEFAAELIAEATEDDRADRSDEEGHGEDGERGKQPGSFVSLGEEDGCDGCGHIGVDGPVEPMDEDADGTGDYALAQPLLMGRPCVGLCVT